MNIRQINFGEFRLDLERRQLFHNEVQLQLGSRAVEILCALAKAKGNLVTKDELLVQVWPDTVIEENNVQVHISALRKTLERMEPGQSYIVTVPGRGYRFLCPSAAFDAHAAGNGDRTIPDKPSIAVLPFDVISDDPQASALSDGLTEDLTAALTKVPVS